MILFLWTPCMILTFFENPGKYSAQLGQPFPTCLAKFEIRVLKHGLDRESQCQWYIHHAGIDFVESIIFSVVRSG